MYQEPGAFFGDIFNGKMINSPLGAIVDVLWHQIPHHFADWELDAFQVMPNHLHGILIKNTDYNYLAPDRLDGLAPSSPKPVTERDRHMAYDDTPAQRRFRNQGANTLSAVIGSFKSAVTRNANRMGLPNGWQTRFHEIIIRDGPCFDNMVSYTENNVAKWAVDKFYSGG